DQTGARLLEEARRIGTPLLIKASAGGGGRGMRVVDDLARFDEALDAAKREAQSAFGSDAILLERYLRRPRHIEFQVLADERGNTIHLGERECSIQRRHQKILEEAPSVALTPQLRAAMGAAAVRAARSVGYVNAGTCEFMLDEDGRFYFLEMNTRLQVEHPVTELVYGIDLGHWQLRIANGDALTIAQDDVRPRGWAIETRIYAEDPANHLLPSTGTISRWEPPQGPGIRVDAGVQTGSTVSVYYDPMLAKLIVWAADRDGAVARLTDALERFHIGGIRANVPLLLWIARDAAYRAGDTTTQFLTERLDESIFNARAASKGDALLAAGALLRDGRAPWRLGGVGIPLRLRSGTAEYALEAELTRDPDAWRLTGDIEGLLRVESVRGVLAVSLDGERYVADGAAPEFAFADAPSLDGAVNAGGAAASGRIVAPMPGKVIKVAVTQGAAVAQHGLLVVLEAMKMEHRIEAPGAGTVKSIFVKEGEIVAGATALVELT
ncbi:MAG: biotin/lipoyl-containing protein, partial [Rhodanobacteraceae bacterium]